MYLNNNNFNFNEEMKKIIEVNVKCIKILFEIAKSEKNIMEDRSLTIIIHDSILWCFNTLNELVDTTGSSKTKAPKKPLSKEQMKQENIVNIHII